MFKILSTLAVFLMVTVWAFRNLKYINDWLVEKTGIGITSTERQEQKVTANTDTTTQ